MSYKKRNKGVVTNIIEWGMAIWEPDAFEGNLWHCASRFWIALWKFLSMQHQRSLWRRCLFCPGHKSGSPFGMHANTGLRWWLLTLEDSVLHVFGRQFKSVSFLLLEQKSTREIIRKNWDASKFMDLPNQSLSDFFRGRLDVSSSSKTERPPMHPIDPRSPKGNRLSMTARFQMKGTRMRAIPAETLDRPTPRLRTTVGYSSAV